MREINRSYNEQEISGVQDYLEVEEDNKKDFERRFNLIENFVKERGTLLDVGCNVGSLISVAQNRNWNCVGIDINERAIEIAKDRGLNCSPQDVFSLEANFDLVVMNDVIEHLENPDTALGKINSLLSESGYVYISTPKGDSFLSKISRGKWLHRKPREHLYIFTSATITAMLERNGFEVVHISTVGRTRSIRVMLKKARVYLPLLSDVLVKITPQFVKNFSIYINPLDEMHVIARKRQI